VRERMGQEVSTGRGGACPPARDPRDTPPEA
jgi:hypothetical protein